MPVRKPKKNYRSLTGAFYSLKNKKSIFFESKLERDFFLTLEFNPDVISYEEQPMELSYQYNNRTYRYTPDCIVNFKNLSSTVYEVKYSNELREKEAFFKHKFTQIDKFLNHKDIAFKIYSELDTKPIVLENMHFIYNYVTITDSLKSAILFDKVKDIHSINYLALLNKLSNDKYTQAEYIPYIWYLVLINKLQIDFTKKISNATILKVVT